MTLPPAGCSISVVVPTYNRAHYLPQCLDSLLAQTVPVAEIIVVDDGSTDDTAACVVRYAPRVTYVHKANGGKPRAVNLGVERALGEWIWVLDDDDVALPEANAVRLRALVGAAPGSEGHAPPDFVFACHRLGHDGPGGVIVPGREHSPKDLPTDRLFVELAQSCFFHLGTALVRRQAFLQLGGLDPALRTGEDYDFQIRLARSHRGVFCPHPVFVFRQHGGDRGSTSDRYRAEQRSATFRRDSRSIGLKLRRETPLARFSTAAGPATGPEVHAEALRERMVAMGNHGCLSEMLQDLAELLATRAGTGLTVTDRQAISAAMRAGWAWDTAAEDWQAFESMALPLRRCPGGRQALGALGQGLLTLARWQPGPWPRRSRQAVLALRLALRALV